MQKHLSPLPFCEKYAMPFSAVYRSEALLGWAHKHKEKALFGKPKQSLFMYQLTL